MNGSFASLPLEELLGLDDFQCGCGRTHSRKPLREVIIKSGAIGELPALLERLGIRRPFLVCDRNTDRAAGEKVRVALDGAGMAWKMHVFPFDRVEPDEQAIGSVLLAYDGTADGIVAVGSGVINDVCKVVARAAGRPQVTVCTAPSMDGYASTCAAMLINGLKTSLYCRVPDALVADLDVLCAAPMRMIQAGLGDMITKYVSLSEWEMANLVNGEFFCREVRDLVWRSAEICFAAAPGLAKRDPKAIAALTEGLILSGIGVTYVNVSGPASGAEHYISHIWDMRNLEAGRPVELHGIQTGVNTLRILKIYEHLRGYTPDREKALAFVRAFDWEAWEADVRRIYGRGAEKAIANEKTAGKHDAAKHARRLERILANWPRLQEMICAMPDSRTVRDLWAQTGAPTTPAEIGRNDTELVEAFEYSPEIRDKYVGSRLIWDLGLMEEAKRWILE